MNEQLLPLAVWVQVTYGEVRLRTSQAWTTRHEEDGVDEAESRKYPKISAVRRQNRELAHDRDCCDPKIVVPNRDPRRFGGCVDQWRVILDYLVGSHAVRHWCRAEMAWRRSSGEPIAATAAANTSSVSSAGTLQTSAARWMPSGTRPRARLECRNPMRTESCSV